jgi:hypothetical protein
MERAQLQPSRWRGETVDLARVLEHVPRDTDRLRDVGGLYCNGDAEAKTVPAAAEFGYKVRQ